MSLDQKLISIITKENVELELKIYEKEFKERYSHLQLGDDYCNFEDFRKKIYTNFNEIYQGVDSGDYEFSKLEIRSYRDITGFFETLAYSMVENKDMYRERAILSIKDAIFLRLMNRSIESYMKKKFKILDDTVYSHRKDKYVHEGINDIYNKIKSEDARYILKFDIVNFYRSIDKSIAIKKIIDFFGKDNKLIAWYFNKYLNNVRFTKGILIEPVLAPIIENIYMFEFDIYLKEELSEEFSIFKYIRFIDDYLLICNDVNIEKLQHKIKKFLKQSNLEIHSIAPKTQIIDLRQSKNKVTYLGFDISRDEINISNAMMNTIKEEITNVVKEVNSSCNIKRLKLILKDINYIFFNGKSKWRKMSLCKICKKKVLEKNLLSYYSIVTNKKKFEELDKYILDELTKNLCTRYSEDTLKNIIKKSAMRSLKEEFMKIHSSNCDVLKYCDCNYYLNGYYEIKGKSRNKRKKGELFFINEIIKLSNEDDSLAILFKEGRSRYPKIQIEELSENHQLALMLKENVIVEGSYIRIRNNEIYTADNDEEVVRRKLQCQYLRNVLSKYFQTDVLKDDATMKDKASTGYSYHINVGHGNCSIVVLEYEDRKEIVMVDCSVYDSTCKKRFDKNIDLCIEHIKTKFKIDEFRINKLLVTHWHYDHINGINEYLFHKHRDYLNNTRIWINDKYEWSKKESLKLLENINSNRDSLSLKLIEPICRNDSNDIEIIYPEKRILAGAPTIPMLEEYDLVPSKMINNSSVIYKVSTSAKTMIFPGDIETDGWNKVKKCEPYLSKHNFYCVSHHGSITGHIRTKCCFNMPIEKVSDLCCTREINIIMGRDGAYHIPGKPKAIINEQVLKDFADRVYRTDEFPNNIEPQFIEVNWQEEKIYYNGIFTL